MLVFIVGYLMVFMVELTVVVDVFMAGVMLMGLLPEVLNNEFDRQNFIIG